MARVEKSWHPNFIAYMQQILAHPNYQGLPVGSKRDGSPKWVVANKSALGEQRKAWATSKAHELGIAPGSGMFAKVMYALHPTKLKVCQVCGESMTIQYRYPNANFTNALVGQFGVAVDVYDTIDTVWDAIVAKGFTTADIIAFINKKFGATHAATATKATVLQECEKLCRLDGKSQLGPGAMSNFPDRFDGFHSYNRCHRASEDKGRSKENLKSYSRDRRAYEYWSDGNIQAANQFMGSSNFYGTSADHVGPISLGFVHDPRYLRPMPGNDNSAKRDRLSKEIIDEVLAIQRQTDVYPMSWYSAKIWDFIANNYTANPGRIATEYRTLLKRNMSNYMYILQTILLAGPIGEKFLVNMLILPKRQDFLYTYDFDALGTITGKRTRNLTERASGEFERFSRVAFAAVTDYNEKDNRHIKHSLTTQEEQDLAKLIALVRADANQPALASLRQLMQTIQNRLIGGIS